LGGGGEDGFDVALLDIGQRQERRPGHPGRVGHWRVIGRRLLGLEVPPSCPVRSRRKPRFQSPPHRTQHADLSHYALLHRFATRVMGPLRWEVFQPCVRRYIDLYFLKKFRAYEVAPALGWTREKFERALAGVVSVVMNGGGRVEIASTNVSRKE